MRELLSLPVDEQPLPLRECETGFSESDLPRPLVGFVGAAIMFLGIAMCKKMLVSGKRKPVRPYDLTPNQRELLKKVIARGEEKRWDFSYDEDFMFKLLPALKAIAR